MTFNLLVSLYVIVGIIIGIIVVLIALYIILAKGKIKDHLKKEEKYIETKDKILSKEFTENLILNIGQDNRYKGTFNSFNSRNKNDALKFVKEFVSEVAPYTLIKENLDAKKYKKVNIIFSKKDDSKKIDNKHAWTFNSKKSYKVNYKDLVKKADRHRCAKALVEVLSKVYLHIKDKTTFPETPMSYENTFYVSFIVK